MVRKRCAATVIPRAYPNSLRPQARQCSNYAQNGEEYCGIHLKIVYPQILERQSDEAATEMAAAINRWERHFNGNSNRRTS